MARGQEGKLRRRNKKKADRDAAEQMLGDGVLMEPVETTDDDEDDDNTTPKKKRVEIKPTEEEPTSENIKFGKGRNRGTTAGSKGIKTTPLILLIIMTGTTILPGLIYLSDFIGARMAKNNFLGGIGYRLNVGSSPKKRVLSFYEKHEPTKIPEVDSIMAKYYGDYPKMIKRLERKYGDYGYFMGWEEDEAPMKLAMEQLEETRAYMGERWNLYAPQPIKTATRNAQYNIGRVVKKGRRMWKKNVWPYLEPVFGVPDGAKAQKRKDAAEARKRRAASTPNKPKRRSTSFRDEDEMEKEPEEPDMDAMLNEET